MCYTATDGYPPLLPRFTTALLAAVPARAALERRVQFGLGAHLNALAPESADLAAPVVARRTGAVAHDRLGDRRAAALTANSTRCPLRALQQPWSARAPAGGGAVFRGPDHANPLFGGPEAELAQVPTLLPAGGLPAVTGPGGRGKPSLAVE